MCPGPDCEDFVRTVFLLGQLALYADTYGADETFVNAVAPCLAVSLPDLSPGVFPLDYNPDDGPDYPCESS